MDWEELVIEFGKQYTIHSHDNIHEFIDGIVPIYYHDIMEEARKLRLYHEVIGPHQVGQSIWKILQYHIYEAYYEEFMNHIYLLEEEE
jgi:hypothetical protein